MTSADLHMATDYTPYEGMELTGFPVTVVVGGRVVVHDARLQDDTPHGLHVPGSSLRLTPGLDLLGQLARTG